ncbi:hypothetical protein ABB37_05872 [Leptomonas pyrrhocoris]|uniref:Uncharacterized protein n=1 Tax=Leptomonas pyrrhocoris TaxID=157538 RepID=A0A0M9FYV8_LEPPY|nr:hypothetical protein ABB37_05872 [Leptomonas pyrrhocoris]XP_015657195.1 hypothetical protein ABB37_05872 [Leptomonas pyrrhocoris]XP_015657196.1 hypothetical protein ABB37_05872 [Leptomonas pyrrhocoris]KPA78755.1 hypothetical protein ABB37_05872 [Leptomonas pyrrhocoris]KPA78756.1 hypothetical protein ABB37_05872 [Leptomonas pyrrhocoris]KPA78757.1 hypothetical protein ABB37_05872 [Leptomonas pyrrhocoris]|eukprot:XP_015657194.1 hypothetical protein ABB37_05872 [Leptomonas pyrrhocoris]
MGPRQHSTTQGITTSSWATRRSAPPTPTQRRGVWLCRMSHGKRQSAGEAQSTVFVLQVANTERPTEQNSDELTCSDDTISSHEGSFYASLRMEQEGHSEQQQHQHQPPRGKMQAVHVTSPASVLTGVSSETSESSFQPEIINFGFTPSSTSPTTTTTNTAGNAWSTSLDQTPSSPFTPAGAHPLPHQRPPPPPPSRQPHSVPTYHAFLPVFLPSSSEWDRALPAVLVQPTASPNSSSSSSRSVTSIPSSSPRTPQQFLAWRKELVELRNAKAGRAQMSKSYSGEQWSVKKCSGACSPLSADFLDFASRSCTSGGDVHCYAFPPLVASSSRNADGGVASLPVTPLTADAHPRHHRIPFSPHDGFSPSVSTSNDRSSSAKSSQANASTTGAGNPLPDYASLAFDVQAGVAAAELPRGNREGWSAGDQVAFALVLAAAFIYALNRYFFIDVTDFFPL